MKKLHLLMFAAILAICCASVFTACTNVDNPYDTAPSDGKYVMLKDSIVFSDGKKLIKNWEYDAGGKVVKETYTNYYTDGTTDQQLNNYTYSTNLITSQVTLSNG